MGIKPPNTHLADPMKSISRAKRAKRALKIVAWMEKRYRKSYHKPPMPNFEAAKPVGEVKYF